jgi:hypothetical protein
MACIYNWILLSHEKGWNPFTYDNIYGNGRHLVKWNKPGTERQIPYVEFKNDWSQKSWK